MNSSFKLSLFAAALAFAVPNIAMAATAQHQDAHKYYKGHRHSKKVTKHNQKNGANQQAMQGDQETADLNARSLQAVQTVNNGGNPSAVQQVVPNPEMQLPSSARVPLSGNQTTRTLNGDSLQDATRVNNGRVVVAPGTGNTVAPPAAPGAVNPNNMPPAQY
ncbi:unnamed protein product [Commensalibacter communis]|uniref:hypothetical protein n=1 Tax=Commensalibacter communis TaxID=2972786 RepID=UPI0022FF545A|nr:hypothetical protein [Commensalibacter communis]CAI3935496.1 unnamed protein product [Commensalibacter communis]